ncbi:MAG: hypothetical protein HDT20_04450 [Oscillibacter sp.]|nr:hypothetical protein [Oscillibacter sp.]
MDSHSENSGPLVPRNAYTQAILKELNAVPYDPEHHNGLRNPYSRKIITCEDDYNEYVREYVYYRLCDEFLNQQYNTHLVFQTDQLEVQHKNEIARIKQEHADEVSRQRRRWRTVSAFLALLLIVALVWYAPSKESAGYKGGYASGSSDGFQQGYNDGYSEALTDSSDFFSNHPTTPKSSIDANRTVYVSRSGHKIHLKSSCSGMMYYDEMTYGIACALGYEHCSKCF